MSVLCILAGPEKKKKKKGVGGLKEAQVDNEA